MKSKAGLEISSSDPRLRLSPPQAEPNQNSQAWQHPYLSLLEIGAAWGLKDQVSRYCFPGSSLASLDLCLPFSLPWRPSLQDWF